MQGYEHDQLHITGTISTHAMQTNDLAWVSFTLSCKSTLVLENTSIGFFFDWSVGPPRNNIYHPDMKSAGLRPRASVLFEPVLIVAGTRKVEFSVERIKVKSIILPP